MHSTTELSKAYYLLNLGWVVVSIFYFNEEGCLNLILIHSTFRDFRDSQHKSKVYEICKLRVNKYADLAQSQVHLELKETRSGSLFA